MTNPGAGSASPDPLPRKLGSWDAFLLSLGVIIGSGVFLTPHDITKALPSAGWMLLIWVVAGILSLMGALSIAELGALFPHAGGLYIYLREAYGPLLAFLYGWALFLVIQTGSVATLAVAFNIYCSYFIPLTDPLSKLVSVGLIFGLSAVNCLGIRYGAVVSNIFTTLKVGAILFMAGAIFFRAPQGSGNFTDPWTLPQGFPLFAGLGGAMIGALWAYEGWHMLSFTAGEIRNPQRNYPVALVSSTAVVMFLYLLANVAYLHVLSIPEMAAYRDVAARSSQRALGDVAGVFIASSIMVSIFGACNGTVLAGPRVFFAMARDGLFFQSLTFIHPRFQTPVVAIVAQGLWSAGLAVAGNFQQLFSYVVFGGWIFYGLAVLAVIVLRRRRPDLPRTYRAPLYPWMPLLFAIMAAFLVMNSLWASPGPSFFGLGFLLLGVPVYWIRRQT